MFKMSKDGQSIWEKARGEDARPFLLTALAWPFLGGAICWLATNPAELASALFWMWVFWVLCLCDLVTLTLTAGAVIRYLTITPEKRGAAAVQAFYWGGLKLACAGIFIVIALWVPGIPRWGILTGLGTLVTVPLIGGFWWSQRVLHHA
jgi:hypothetical protein